MTTTHCDNCSAKAPKYFIWITLDDMAHINITPDTELGPRHFCNHKCLFEWCAKNPQLVKPA